MKKNIKNKIIKQPNDKKKQSNAEFLWDVSQDISGSNTPRPTTKIELDPYLDSC